jgi:flagellar biosynthesis/type III secretory pathway protein FliH
MSSSSGSGARPGVARAAQVLAADAAGALPAWAPLAWEPAPLASTAGAGVGSPAASGAQWDDFTPGLPAAGPTSAASLAPAPAAHGGLAALLPDFGVHAPRAGGSAAVDAGRRAIARAIAEAADAREAELRAAFEAASAEQAAVDAERLAAEVDAAYAAGVEAGRAEGEAAAHDALAGAAATLDVAATEVRTHEARWLGDLEAHVAALAVAVARHLVEREVVRDDTLVTDLVARAVAEFPADQPLTVRAHPADLPALRAAWAGAAGAARSAELRWLPDAGVVRGGALVEGRERIVDGRVDAALERVYRAVGGHQA